GTPGSKNQIEKDTTPPKLRYVNVTNSKIITLKFSEQLSAGTAFKTDNYIFKPNILIDKITFSNRTAILRLEQPLKPEKEYTLTVKNMEDIFGNKLKTVSEKLIYIPLSE